tara:strand:- start:155 stop:316 length:162 start_codon:yes stop_codon:yes gene_type:complete
MEVKQGEKWYLSGANGSGKSTFLNLLNNLSLAQKSPQNIDNKDSLNTQGITAR